MSTENEIVEIVRDILRHQGLACDAVSLASLLYDDGLGLDSLCVAELSATLEKRYGTDPYTSGQLPQTVGDIVEFYTAA